MTYLDRLLASAAAATALVSAAPMLAAHWWGFDLLSHFRAQYLGAQLILLTVLTFRRRWAWSVALVPFVTLNAAPLLPYWPGVRVSAEGRPQLKIMSANVESDNTQHRSLLTLIARESPDVILLVEFNAGWAQAIEPLAERYAHQIRIPRADRFGIALLSRLPFEEQRSFDLLTTPAVEARVDVLGTRVRVLGVHLRPPTSQQWANERNEQLDALGDLLGASSEPTAVIGDFNVTPFSPYLSRMMREAALKDARRRRGLSFTWPTFLPVFGIPIDHCLVSEEFSVLEHRRGPAFGSDHYPIVVTLAPGRHGE